MTVKELIEKLSTEDPEALVYIMEDGDDLAFIVTEVLRDILEGKEKTVVIR